MIHISYNGLIHNPTKMSRANVESLGDIRPEQPKVALFVLQKQGCHVILPPSYTQLADCHSELCPQDTNCVRPITAVKHPLHENSPNI